MNDIEHMTDLQLEVADAKAREDLAAAFGARKAIARERERRASHNFEQAPASPSQCRVCGLSKRNRVHR